MGATRPASTLFPYTTLFRSDHDLVGAPEECRDDVLAHRRNEHQERPGDDAGEGLRQRRSEEHTSELQSHLNLVCRLLLETKNRGQSKVHLRCCGNACGCQLA